MKLRVLVVFLLFGVAAYLIVVFNWSYSDGERAGYLQKFSRKGWVCKTHEGELAMTTVPGVAPLAAPHWEGQFQRAERPLKPR